jgi:hypothetical protein
MNDSGGHLRGLTGILVARAGIFRRLRGDPRVSTCAASLHLVSGLKDTTSESRIDVCDRKDADRKGTAFLGSIIAHVRRFVSGNPEVSATNCKGKREEDTPLSRISGLIKQSAGFP